MTTYLTIILSGTLAGSVYALASSWMGHEPKTVYLLTAMCLGVSIRIILHFVFVH